jgi:HAD domain in Swiss Army Knife RNA repair proteins
MYDTATNKLKESIHNKKILFLDIDGVLNSEAYYKSSSHKENYSSRFDPQSVEFIKKLVEEFSLQIVISSTWRYGAVDRLMHELKNSELIKYLYHEWFTPVIHPAHRGREIKLWLDLHPEVTDYIIIDDDENILEEQMNRFVKTGLHEGMTEEHFNRVRAILSETEPIEK